jgi:hypothetical protein
MTVLALISALAGFALFGGSTDAHHLRRFGDRPTSQRRGWLRRAAWAAIALSFVFSVAARGWVFGPVLWPGLLMLAAGAVFLFLNFAPEPEKGSR